MSDSLREKVAESIFYAHKPDVATTWWDIIPERDLYYDMADAAVLAVYEHRARAALDGE